MIDLHALHQAGRLSQRCPDCALVEAAGNYCTRCALLTGPETWFSAAHEGGRGRAKKTQGTAAGPTTHADAPDGAMAFFDRDFGGPDGSAAVPA